MTNRKLHHRRLIFSMASLVDLGQEATSSKDLSEKMTAALYVITGMFSVPSASLFLYHPQRKNLELFVDKGPRDKTLRGISLPVLPEHIRRLRKNDPHTLRELAGSGLLIGNSGLFAKRQMKVFLPHFVKGEFVGAITLGRKLGGTPFRQGDKDILRVIAHQMAIAAQQLLFEAPDLFVRM